ncbi:MAG: deoxynucleoside kinase [Planctomycetes bacterium]|jgi:deoxyguanosine kinase|nr:deoxynucleoside kinase [Phycisphaerae bacterium]NBB95457.1 deoxynucleoside kinase [Planctomycetota bacterium]
MGATLVSLIGPPAVGKTTLAELLAERLAADLRYEDFENNPFLVESFTGQDDLFLPGQLTFMLSRARQLSEAFWPESGWVVSDYGYCQDRIYAAGKLSEPDLAIYDTVADRVAPTVVDPAVIIHLDAGIETLLDRIGDRGREYERAFSREFIEYMRAAHHCIEPPAGGCIVRIDADATDPREPAALDALVGQLRRTIAATETAP